MWLLSAVLQYPPSVHKYGALIILQDLTHIIEDCDTLIEQSVILTSISVILTAIMLHYTNFNWYMAFLVFESIIFLL